LIFRNTIPYDSFTLAGDYYPQGVFCREKTFVDAGWRPVSPLLA
jgi:hypothetical protein